MRQGEYVSKLAWERGATADEVWGHPKNASLRAVRRHLDILTPGDILFLPDARPPALPLKRGMNNRYVAKVPKVDVTLRLLDGGAPLANEPYRTHGLPTPAVGTTDGDARVTLRVPLHVREVTVELPQKGLFFSVRVGDMDCASEGSGLRSRLHNLGYYRDPLGPSGEGAALREAIALFQRRHGLPDTGEIDDATRDAITEAHGS